VAGDGEDDQGGPTSIAAAKHRFASFSLPLGQVTDNLATVLKLCSKISLIRGSSGEWATKLLQTFSGKKAVLLAMACDAAATCSEFTRALDNEEAGVAQLNERCGHFALSVQALLVSEKIWNLPTYTKFWSILSKGIRFAFYTRDVPKRFESQQRTNALQPKSCRTAWQCSVTLFLS